MASSRKPLTEEELGRYAEDIMSESSDDCIQDPNFELPDSENESEFSDNSESDEGSTPTDKSLFQRNRVDYR
ncbi:unnamed protein product [Didymodactylos carnosus]|uniref:Uncharacterized protein n=1 Tax=Didymodactylos carnosus TaxID=1234261 RepID=A0A814VXM4_9BILA|nr:unnamed protein product [Didymodactylos carnosus]CAF3958406.1 unnamed protein product [Didymodactylos carnosus]